jgi:hypothetical protein
MNVSESQLVRRAKVCSLRIIAYVLQNDKISDLLGNKLVPMYSPIS